MKKSVRRFTEAGLVFLWLFVVGFGMMGQVSAQGATGEQYCEVALAGCPQDYDGAELVIPLDAVAISAQIRACGYVDTTTTQGGGGASSVVFIIDQSTSMYNFDRDGNRFTVTSALLDTINRASPQTEVSIIVFRNDLLFSIADDSNLVRIGTSGGAYMPFLTMNQSADIIRGGVFGRDSSHSGGTALTGYDVLKNMMVTRDSVNRQGQYVRRDIAYRPFFGSSGTNITRAFDAARAVLANATNPPDNQFIIFISDGESNRPSGNANIAERDRYMRGENVPTTFTVFLSPTLTVPPTQLITMTDNIKINGYSTNNEKSDIWILASDYDSLMTLMMENIIRPMLSTSSGEAKSITITSGGVSDSAGVAGENVTFSRRLPIDTTDITTVEMNIRYDVRIDSTWRTEAGTDTTVLLRIARDSLFTYTFDVRRTANPPEDWRSIHNLTWNCGVKPTLDLQFQGTSVVGSEVKGNMDRLTIVLDNTGGLFNYGNNIRVQVMNADSTFRDIEDFTLTRPNANSQIYTISFPRAVADVANPNNGTLQHASQDSIIVFFRNPEIPLDTLRISVPYISTTMSFYDTNNPNTGNRFDDTVTIRAGESLDLHAIFFDSDGVWDTTLFQNSTANITWNLDKRNGTLTSDGQRGTFYSEDAGQMYTVTATYRDGPLVIVRSIMITVVPDAPRYLEVVFDTTNIVARVTDTNALKQNKTYEFDKDVDRTIFYVLERDRFGNLIGNADGSAWTSNYTNSILADAQDNGSSALITRRGHTFGDSLMVIVEKNGLADTVHIKVIGESSVAVGPNPFVPGKSSVTDMLSKHGEEVLKYYDKIIHGDGSPGSSSNTVGVLIAATSPRSIQKNANNQPVATIMIYDAVGNIVFRSKPGDIRLTDDGTTFGFVWDGKNQSGRTVGPGTYLVRMVGTQENGQRFSTQRKVGVTVDGRTK